MYLCTIDIPNHLIQHGQSSGLRGVELRRVGAGLTVIARFANALSDWRAQFDAKTHIKVGYSWYFYGIFMVFLWYFMVFYGIFDIPNWDKQW